MSRKKTRGGFPKKGSLSPTINGKKRGGCLWENYCTDGTSGGLLLRKKEKTHHGRRTLLIEGKRHLGDYPGSDRATDGRNPCLEENKKFGKGSQFRVHDALEKTPQGKEERL